MFYKINRINIRYYLFAADSDKNSEKIDKFEFIVERYKDMQQRIEIRKSGEEIRYVGQAAYKIN